MAELKYYAKQSNPVIMEHPEIAGRFEEIKILNQILASDEAEFIAVYGRRRIGKTYLVKKFFSKHICFALTGMFRVPLQNQLRNFAKSLAKSSRTNIIPPTPVSWQEAFFQLENYLESPLIKKKRNKQVIFLDELPWLNSPRSGFLPSLENFWNTFGSQKKNLVLVVCGSAASWMIQKIVRAKGGLHNRLTRQIRLLPFTLKETEDYFKFRKIKLTRYQIVQLYMVFGGVPFYLKQVERGMSVTQVIDRACFTKDGTLRYEFDKLYTSLFDQSNYHEKIVELLSHKNKGLTRNEILKSVGIKTGGTATTIMNELQESGFIDSYIPFGKSSKDQLFKLSDEFTKFYFDWIEPLGKRTPGLGFWQKKQNQPATNSWAGFSFESLCLKHVSQIKKALGIALVESGESTWRYIPVGNEKEEGSQIDLIIDRKDATINLCEIKFAGKPFVVDAEYAAKLRRRREVFVTQTGTRKSVLNTFITSFGTHQNEHALEAVDNSIQMEELF